MLTLYGYDDASNQTGVTDSLTHESTATYDAMHRPLTQVDALLGETDYDYDVAGNLYTLTDPVGNVTTYTTRAAAATVPPAPARPADYPSTWSDETGPPIAGWSALRRLHLWPARPGAFQFLWAGRARLGRRGLGACIGRVSAPAESAVSSVRLSEHCP
jgi:YD repeat-containing protein